MLFQNENYVKSEFTHVTSNFFKRFQLHKLKICTSRTIDFGILDFGVTSGDAQVREQFQCGVLKRKQSPCLTRSCYNQNEITPNTTKGQMKCSHVKLKSDLSSNKDSK